MINVKFKILRIPILEKKPAFYKKHHHLEIMPDVCADEPYNWEEPWQFISSEFLLVQN